MESNKEDIYKYAIKLLAKKNYTKLKLKEKIKTKFNQENKINDTIKKLNDIIEICEKNYINSRISSYMKKGYSINWIRYKLGKEKINIDMAKIKGIFRENKITTNMQIKYLIKKKNKTNKNVSNKIISYILGRGHSIEEIKKNM